MVTSNVEVRFPGRRLAARLSALGAVLAFTLVSAPVTAPSQAEPTIPTVGYPGSVTVRMTYVGVSLTYEANATGWARTGTTCIDWKLFYGKSSGPNGTTEWTQVKSGRKCGTGSFETGQFWHLSECRNV
ncbi:hypothetical protein GCM10022237_28250 [Nocardioides ginsengisoli]